MDEKGVKIRNKKSRNDTERAEEKILRERKAV